MLLQLGAQGKLLAALATGSIDAAVLSDPTTYAAHKAGYSRLVKLRDLGMSVQHVVIISRRSYVDAHPDVTERFLRAYGDAIRYLFTNRHGTLEVMAKYLKDMDPDLLGDAYDGLREIIPHVPYPMAEGIRVALDELGQTDERASTPTWATSCSTAIARWMPRRSATAFTASVSPRSTSWTCASRAASAARSL
jgi:ABC-type taurine transport system substrate-binding protein